MKNLLGRNVEKIGINADLMKVLGLASVVAIELIVSIEEKVGVDLSEQEIEDSKTVGNLISMLYTAQSRVRGAVLM